MKQKYTLTIADMDLSVVSEAPSEEVEKIVGILDRRIRAILLKSQTCSKIEATLLCALDLCGDKLQIKEALEEVISDLEDAKEKNAVLEEKLALLEKNIEKTEKECARLQAENKRLMFNGSMFKHEAPAESKPEETEEPAPTDNGAKAQRSRVGEMFDMLTFTDI